MAAFQFRPLAGFECPLTEEESRRVLAGLKLLVSAIIRDFWVIEEREAVFGQKAATGPARIQRQNDERRRIVYIPRIHYTHKPDLDQCTVRLGHQERRAHFVRAHLRRSEHPSKHQLVLAQRYGFDVPLGYTFVSTHERGKKKAEVIYRSRSALRCLYTAVDEGVPTSKHVLWFKFERDVHDLMKKLGFDVQHVSASGRGDRGVDVYATKGSDLEEVNWVIQCKCVHPKRKLGPHVIREMIGTLDAYPRGTRGMVVTTSQFSTESTDLAESVAIRLVDGEEFNSLLSQ